MYNEVALHVWVEIWMPGIVGMQNKLLNFMSLQRRQRLYQNHISIFFFFFLNWNGIKLNIYDQMEYLSIE